MGKGNRTKRDRATRASEADKYLRTSDKAKNKKAKKSGVIISIICIVLVVVMLSAVVITVVENTGVVPRLTNVMKTENGKYKVNKAMMNFFFNEQIMSWYSNYGTYAQYFGVDFSVDLDDQIYSKETGETWYDYFLTQTEDQVKLYLAYANEADKMGLSLDDEDIEEIDKTIETLEEYIASMDTYAALYGSYVGIMKSDIEAFYGTGTKKSDIKDCYEIIYMANKYSEVMTEKYKEDLEKDNSSVIKFPEDNKEDFYTADVLKYSIKLDSKNYATDSDYDNAVTEAKARAEKIANAKTPEEFLELVKLDLVIVKEFEDSLKTETDTKKDNATEAPTEAPELEDYRQEIKFEEENTEVVTDKDGETVTEKDSVSDWVWGYGSFKEEGSAEAGEHFTEESSETYTEKATTSSTETSTETSTEKKENKEYKRYTISAYHLEKPYHLDDAPARHLGYIISSDKTLAQSILDNFIAGTTKSAEVLDKLGADALAALPEDTTISIGHANEKYVLPKTFTNNQMTAMEEWLEEEGRKAGDYTEKLVEIKTTSGSTTVTYYGICYYEADTKPSWEVNAINGVVNETFETWYKGVTAEGGAHYVTVNDRGVSGLHQTKMPALLALVSSLSSGSLTS